MEVSGDESEGDCLCEMSDCLLASVPNLISLVEVVCELDPLLVSDFQCDGPQKLRFPESVAPVLHWSASSTRERRASMETTPVQSMPVPNKTPLKAVLDCVGNSGKANDWRNREHVVLDLFSN